MTMRSFFLSLITLLLAAPYASSQIAISINDSTGFDDSHARLREVDYEDVYSATIQGITFRNPWGLNAMGITDTTQADSVDTFLWLGQGATIDFPTRTRTVELAGYANPFYVTITDFNDSSYTRQLDSFPLVLASDAGIARIQLLGTDGNGNDDINWQGGLLHVTSVDENGDTLADTDFEELKADHYYLIGREMDAGSFDPSDSAMFGPVTWRGVTVTESYIGFGGTFLTEGEGRIDPDNPIGNLAIELSPGGTVEFPEGTEGAMLTLEKFHYLDSAWFEVEDYAGELDTVMITAAGQPVDTSWVEWQRYTYLHLGASSPNGIKRFTFLGNTAAVETTVYLTTVAVAETPQAEIASIASTVQGLDTLGYIGDNVYQAMRSQLEAAAMLVEKNDRAGAIATLEAFRGNVGGYHASNVLVDEEAEHLSTEAAYVISRLGGASSVRAGESSVRRASIRTIVAGEGLRIEYMAPAGSRPVIRIVDMRGATLRTIRPGVAEESVHDLLWDGRDDAGNALPYGAYLILLDADGVRANPSKILVGTPGS